MKIDSHQHFWKYQAEKHAWIDETMGVIRRDFGPSNLAPLLAENGLDGCVAVQADQREAETHYLLQLATEYDIIKGVVGWIDLQRADIEEHLAYYKTFPLLKGFRHVVQGEAPGFMERAAFRRGIKALGKYGFTYDVLIYHHQLQEAIELVEEFPEQPFVLDHIAKPSIVSGAIDAWKNDIQALASHSNVSCKVSGMITEANWATWRKEDIIPYIDVVVSAFGMDRVMYGSDWPVCLVAGSYAQVKGLVNDYFKSFTTAEQQKFWGGNAVKFYSL